MTSGDSTPRIWDEETTFAEPERLDAGLADTALRE
jgi:hypothetical protein